MTEGRQRRRAPVLSSFVSVAAVVGAALAPLPSAEAQAAAQPPSNCAQLPRVGPGPSCAASIERGGAVCEWTGDCGAIEGSDCSNKCIASLAPLRQVASVQTGALQAPGITYCHLLGAYLNQAYTIVQASTPEPTTTITYNSTDNGTNSTTEGKPAPASLTTSLDASLPNAAPHDPDAGAFTAPQAPQPAAARRRLQDAAAAGEGCPTGEMIDEIAASPAWPSILRAPLDILDRSVNPRDRPSLFGSLNSADALKAFFANACKTEAVQPPLSALFPAAEQPAPGTCPADAPLQPRTVCRDSLGLLEAAYGDFSSAATLTEFLQAASDDMSAVCAAARSAAPGAACSPAVWLMDAACMQRTLDLLGAPLPDNRVTNGGLRGVAAAYVELHKACSALTTKEECFRTPFPQLLDTATSAVSRILPDIRGPRNPEPADAPVRTAGDAPVRPGGDAAAAPAAPGAAPAADAPAAAGPEAAGTVPESGTVLNPGEASVTESETAAARTQLMGAVAVSVAALLCCVL